MKTIFAFLVGGLVAVAIFLILKRSIVKLLMGLVIISQATHLLIFTSGGIIRAQAPIIEPESLTLLNPYADPLPQALILTAIVISFSVLAFSLVLVYRAHQVTQTDDVDQMKGECA